MPTTIDSAGITFNDATTLTSANIGSSQIAANAVGSTQIANGSVTAAKLGTTEQKQIAKAWVNFDGTFSIGSTANAATGQSISVTSGSNVGTWVNTASWPANYIGITFYITSIGGVANATLGGVNVSSVPVQITAVSGVNATIKLLGGNATSSQTINGNGASSGWTFGFLGIRSSYNVSSITKNGTGNYTVNFASALADANYSWSGSVDGFGNITNGAFIGLGPINTYPIVKTTSSLRVIVQDNDAGATDGSQVSIIVFGN